MIYDDSTTLNSHEKIEGMAFVSKYAVKRLPEKLRSPYGYNSRSNLSLTSVFQVLYGEGYPC
jgi:hypothetical protein